MSILIYFDVFFCHFCHVCFRLGLTIFCHLGVSCFCICLNLCVIHFFLSFLRAANARLQKNGKLKKLQKNDETITKNSSKSPFFSTSSGSAANAGLQRKQDMNDRKQQKTTTPNDKKLYMTENDKNRQKAMTKKTFFSDTAPAGK